MTKQAEAKEDAKPLNVYQAIAKVQGELAQHGIAKDRRNEQQKYSFRGIDDVYNALAPLLAKCQLCILPTVETREVAERVNIKTDQQGGKRESVLFYVTVRVRFDFVSAGDGSKHEVVTYGEAMDSGDKATNKAMSAAYKYACLQTFCIPTEGDNDADGTTHEVAAKDVLFPTPQARKAFTDACLDQIGKATGPADLKTVKETNLAKWNAMGASKDQADTSAWNLIKESYNAKMASFKAKNEPQTVAATVDAAVGTSAGSVLGNDTITF
jgi:hypothetical protein